MARVPAWLSVEPRAGPRTHWPEARTAMRNRLDLWEKEGFSFTLEWLRRNTNAVATGRAEFSSLDAVSVTDFRQAL
jgi:hypothetical protein